jgi:hypothetical protein
MIRRAFPRHVKTTVTTRPSVSLIVGQRSSVLRSDRRSKLVPKKINCVVEVDLDRLYIRMYDNLAKFLF